MVANVRSKAIITTGFPQVDNLLATLEPKLQKKAIRKGTRRGAKEVFKDALQLVPVDFGTLHDTLAVRTAGGKENKLPRGTLGHTVVHRTTGAEDPFYSRFVEFGTVKWEGDRYIRIALYDNEKRVLSAVRQEMVRGVNEIAAKERMKFPPAFSRN